MNNKIDSNNKKEENRVEVIEFNPDTDEDTLNLLLNPSTEEEIPEEKEQEVDKEEFVNGTLVYEKAQESESTISSEIDTLDAQESIHKTVEPIEPISLTPEVGLTTDNPFNEPWLDDDGHTWQNFMEFYHGNSAECSKAWKWYKANRNPSKSEGRPSTKRKTKKPADGTFVVSSEEGPQKKITTGIRVSGQLDTELGLIYQELVNAGQIDPKKQSMTAWVNELASKRVKDEGYEVITQKKYGGGTTTSISNDSMSHDYREIERMSQDARKDQIRNLQMENLQMQTEQQRLDMERRKRDMYDRNQYGGGYDGYGQRDEMVDIMIPQKDTQGNIIGYETKKVHKVEVPHIMKALEADKFTAAGKGDTNNALILSTILNNQPKNDDTTAWVLKELIRDRGSDGGYRGRGSLQTSETEKLRLELEKQRQEFDRKITEERRERDRYRDELANKRFEDMQGSVFHLAEKIKESQSNKSVMDRYAEKLFEKLIDGNLGFSGNASAQQLDAMTRRDMTGMINKNLDRVGNLVEAKIVNDMNEKAAYTREILNENTPIEGGSKTMPERKMKQFIENKEEDEYE